MSSPESTRKNWRPDAVREDMEAPFAGPKVACGMNREISHSGGRDSCGSGGPPTAADDASAAVLAGLMKLFLVIGVIEVLSLMIKYV